MQGFILEVSISPSGNELDEDVLVGATTITLTDSSDFPADGGSLEINGTTYDYSSITVDELEEDPVGVVELVTGLIEDLEAGERVYLVPYVYEKWAMVEVSGQDEPISALIGGELYDKVTDGVRDPEGQEAVYLEMQEDGDWVVTRPLGEEPVISGEFLDPDTVPVPGEVETELDDLRADVEANSGQLENILGTDTTEGRLETLEETATEARNLANTADGRVSMSDYEPAPEDAQYIATDVNGDPILDADTGLPVLLNRNEGSVWFTRTRTRINQCGNPSFETGVHDWSTSELAMARIASAEVAGSYVLELTNTTTAGEHVLTWDNGLNPRMDAVPGADYTWSIFAALITGLGTGVVARLEFFDAAGASVGTFDGTPADLLVGDYLRPNVTATAPDTAATYVGHVVNPNASDVWRVDAALPEMSNILGRYFDGTFYDAIWEGDLHDSSSLMTGGKVIKVFELDDGAWIEKVFTGDTLADIDAGQITHGPLAGELLVDRSVPIDKLAGTPGVAFEALVAGELVHLSNESGEFRVRKASAATGLEAHGFVLESAAQGAVAYVYSHGYNPFMFELEPGTQFLSTEPGQVSNTPPQEIGTMVQRVGVAIGDSVLNFMQNTPVFIT